MSHFWTFTPNLTPILISLPLFLPHKMSIPEQYRYISTVPVHRVYISQLIRDLDRYWLSCFGSLVFLLPKTFICHFSSLLILSEHDEGYSKNAYGALNYISTCLSLSRYLCWLTISPREFHPPMVSISALALLIRYIYY